MKQISSHPNFNTFVQIANTHVEDIKHMTLATRYMESAIERSHDFYLDKNAAMQLALELIEKYNLPLTVSTQ